MATRAGVVREELVPRQPPAAGAVAVAVHVVDDDGLGAAAAWGCERMLALLVLDGDCLVDAIPPRWLRDRRALSSIVIHAAIPSL